MMIRLLVGVVFLAISIASYSQHLSELPDPHPLPTLPWNSLKNAKLGWGSIDHRYQKNEFPQLGKNLQLRAWRGERVSAQAVFMTPADVKKLSFKVSDMKCGRNVIPAAVVNKYFVCYSMGDSFYQLDGKKNYDHSNKSLFDSCLVADRLAALTEISIPGNTLRPLWLDIRVPQQTNPGIYKGMLKAEFDGKELAIPFSVEVCKQVLPEPSKWHFHLDLWQNPYSVARYYNVPLWSKEHFDKMRPIMKLLADAGQKVITTSIIQHPWNGQTKDPFESMIRKSKKINGEWTYDYEVFDKWVDFMMEIGINQQIDCYTLVPWHLKFEYFDEAINCSKSITLKPGTKEYKDFLLPFLKDFAAHLKQKGWWEKTCIAMDERPMDMLRAAWDVVYEADPAYRIEGAAKYYPEVEPKMYDLCLYITDPYLPESVLQARVDRKAKTTFYTCCGPCRPNTFTFSLPAESTYMGWHAMALGFDGYLRWAYNSWVDDPNTDGRFQTWASGDCFMVYPDGSSIRMERLVQGIQDYEKIRILKEQLKGAKLQMLEKSLEPFKPITFDDNQDATPMIHKAEDILWSLSK